MRRAVDVGDRVLRLDRGSDGVLLQGLDRFAQAGIVDQLHQSRARGKMRPGAFNVVGECGSADREDDIVSRK